MSTKLSDQAVKEIRSDFVYNQLVNDEALIEFVKRNYIGKFEEKTFEENLRLYSTLPTFKANENIHEVVKDNLHYPELIDAENEFINGDSLKPEVHWIMRSIVQFHLLKAFDAMKIDLTDPNIAINALGKGTPGRIAKMWCGNDPEDTTELGSGRWNKEPALSLFPNESGNRDIITKQVDVVASCSHHFLPFSSFDGGKVTISYIPKNHILGISKLQRFVTWCARRFWLQEDLTAYIGKTIQRIAQTKDVWVKMEGLVHGCEKFRGANAKDGSLNTEFKDGFFKTGELDNDNYIKKG